MGLPIQWTPKEEKSLLKTISKHEVPAEAIAAHNRQWKTERSKDSIEHKIQAMGYPGWRALLKPPKPKSRRSGDTPADKQVNRLIEVLKRNQGADLTKICDALDLSPKRLDDLVRLARAMGHAVEAPDAKTLHLALEAPVADSMQVHSLPIEPIADTITFGVTADQHHGSKHHRQKCLEDFVNIAYEDFGVRDILDCGDILSGYGVYKGHTFDVVDPSFEGQVEIALKDIPRRKGLSWHMIAGNHDESFYKLNGADVLKRIGGRPDIKTYGYYSALIDLKPQGRPFGIKTELYHMAQAGAYAISYHLQKAIEQIPPGMKPQLLFCGHPHVMFDLPDYRGVAGYVCGCFEDQTTLGKRLHLSPSIGGLIIKVGIAKDGTARSLTHTWVRYYHSRRGPLISREGDNQIRFVRSMGLPVDV